MQPAESVQGDVDEVPAKNETLPDAPPESLQNSQVASGSQASIVVVETDGKKSSSDEDIVTVQPRNPRCNGFYEEQPEWMRDNEYILTRYRIDYEGTREVASTFCMCHNETVNIWSHFIGSVIMLTIGIFILVNYENVKIVAEYGW